MKSIRRFSGSKNVRVKVNREFGARSRKCIFTNEPWTQKIFGVAEGSLLLFATRRREKAKKKLCDLINLLQSLVYLRNVENHCWMNRFETQNHKFMLLEMRTDVRCNEALLELMIQVWEVNIYIEVLWIVANASIGRFMSWNV